VHELNQQLQLGAAPQLVDVRREREWESGHIPGAKQIYVADMQGQLDELDREQPVVTYCGTGYRASIASSLLEQAGFTVKNIPGSMSAWRQAGFPEEK
jgi:hydroxyacylglutathione hydrolase